MKIVKNLCPQNKWSIKCPYSMTPRFIVVHNTANDASARNEIAYMIGNNDSTSYHYAVDDVEVIQAIPENRTAWHAGDGIGKGNMSGISIEICYSKSGGSKFNKAEDNAVELIVDILRRYGWGIDKVTKHQDYSGKYCPHRTLDMGWDRFLKKVHDRLGGLTMGQYEELKSAIDKTADRVTKLEKPMVYNYIDSNMPDFAKPTIKKLVDKGYLKGDNAGLGLDMNMMRMLVILDRSGAFDH